MTNEITLEILKYIAEEVERQGDGPVAVYDMARAWTDAMEMKRGHVIGSGPTLRDIERWGQLIAPQKNMFGYRKGLVSIGGVTKKPWPMYLHDLEALVANPRLLTPEEMYYNFELIHPFNDGNGRTGKILFNYLKGTLHTPEMPPNFFGCSNP